MYQLIGTDLLGILIPSKRKSKNENVLIKFIEEEYERSMNKNLAHFVSIGCIERRLQYTCVGKVRFEKIKKTENNNEYELILAHDMNTPEVLDNKF